MSEVKAVRQRPRIIIPGPNQQQTEPTPEDTAKLERAIEVLERRGWSVEQSTINSDKEPYLCMSWYSPMDEDFTIERQGKDAQINSVNDLHKIFFDEHNGFDPDEHASMWIEARGNVAGVPSSLEDLIEDAKAIETELDECCVDMISCDRGEPTLDERNSENKNRMMLMRNHTMAMKGNHAHTLAGGAYTAIRNARRQLKSIGGEVPEDIEKAFAAAEKSLADVQASDYVIGLEEEGPIPYTDIAAYSLDGCEFNVKNPDEVTGENATAITGALSDAHYWQAKYQEKSREADYWKKQASSDDLQDIAYLREGFKVPEGVTIRNHMGQRMIAKAAAKQAEKKEASRPTPEQLAARRNVDPDYLRSLEAQRQASADFGGPSL